MSEEDKRLWERVCASVRRWGDLFPSAPAPVRHVPAAPQHYLDLHGYTVDQAHAATVEFLAETKFKAVTIITGRSGQIKREFPRWMETLNYRYATLNEGAFRINTKRVPRPTRKP